MDAMEMANSLPMWIGCGLPVCVVLGQAVIFALHAYKAGKRIGLTEEQMKKGMKSAAVTSIGPSVVVMSGMLSLLITMGAPIAWMRLSMIGSVMFEATAAGIGTGTVGVELGTDAMTPQAFCMAVWTMVICSSGWLLFATLFADRMNKVRLRISGGDSQRLIRISASAVIGVFAAMAAPYLIRFTSPAGGLAADPAALACVLGGVCMACMMRISKKHPALKEWNLTIAVMVAVAGTVLLQQGGK